MADLDTRAAGRYVALHRDMKAQADSVAKATQALMEMHDFFRELKLNSESQLDMYRSEKHRVKDLLLTGELPEDAYSAAAASTHATRLQAVEASRKALEMEKRELEEQVREQKRRVQEVVQANLQEKAHQQTRRVQAYQNEIDSLKGEVHDLKAGLVESEAALSKAKNSAADAQSAVLAAETRAEQAEETLQKIQKALRARDNELQEARSEIETFKVSSVQLRVAEKEAKAELEVAERTKKEVMEKHEGLKRDALRRQEELERSLARIAAFERAESGGRQQIASYEDAIAALEEDRRQLREKTSHLEEQLMEERKCGKADLIVHLKRATEHVRAVNALNEELRAALTTCMAELIDASGHATSDTAEEVQVLSGLLAELEASSGTDDQGASTLMGMRERLERAVRSLVQNEARETDRIRELYMLECKRRRKLHNKLQELKGNIRVLVRLRPMNQMEKVNAAGAQTATASDDMTLRVVDGRMGPRSFEFDRVFAPHEGQVPVFAEVEDLVTSCCDGYNVCIFAYGQTGSGKTHTMEGTHDDPGVFYRALDQLFTEKKSRSETHTMTISASAVEVYNEAVRDLLSARGRDVKLEVKQSADGMFVQDLVIYQCRSIDDYHKLLRTAKTNRSTFATDMNEHSSRSHMIFSVYVRTMDNVSGVEARAKLHMVDLAGSERLSKSHARGDRLVEAQAINRSLSSLGDVIQALHLRGKQGGHIPFRNSKLTYLLQDSLGGNSKVLMIAAVSPAAFNASETMSTLTFARRAMKVELGKQSRNLLQTQAAAKEAADDEGAGLRSRFA